MRRLIILLLFLLGTVVPAGVRAQRPIVTPTPASATERLQQTSGCDPVSEKRSADRRKLYQLFQGLMEVSTALGSERQLLQRLEELKSVYRGSRLGPMHYLSSAMVRIGASLRSQGRELVAQEFVTSALELWPGNADAYELSARLHLDSGIVGLPLAALAWGQGLTVEFSDFWRTFLLAHRLAMWASVILMGIVMVWLLNWTIVYYRLWCHDLSEMMSSLPGSISYLIGALLPILPLLAGQGLLWSAFIVLVLSWPYAARLEKWLMGLIGIILIAVPSLSEQGSAALRFYDQPLTHALIYAEEGPEWNEQVWNDLADISTKSRRDGLPHFLLGNLYYESHCYFDAIDRYEQATSIDPTLAKALNNLGNSLYQQGNMDGAIVKYRAAERMDPSLCSAPINLNLTFNEKFEFDEANKALDRAKMACPNTVSKQVDRDITLLDKHDSVISEPIDTAQVLRELYEGNMMSSPPLLADLWPANLLGVEFESLPTFGGALLLLFFIRSTLISVSRKTRYCLKCSRPTCPKCQLVQSSQLYCGQCVRLFILRSGIDAQVQREGVMRTNRLQTSAMTRARMANLFLPGSGHFLAGRKIAGLLLVTVWAILWALYLRPELAEFDYLDILYAPKQILNAVLILLAALVWALANLAIPIQE